MIYDANSGYDYITVLEPILLTDSMLTSSTVPDPDTSDPALWVAASTYAIGDFVRRPNHRIYRALLAGVDAGLPENTPLRWFDYDNTNRWGMLANKKGSPTVSGSPLTVVLHPGRANALWMKLDATGVTVTVKDAPGGTVVYTKTSDLEGSEPADYWEWCFDPFQPSTDLLLDDLPPYGDMEITVTATSGGTINFFALLVGSITFLAETTVGCSAKPRSLSTINVNSNGDNITKDGAATKDLTLKGIITKIDDADYTVDTVSRLLTKNCLWSGSANANYTALRAYGIGSLQADYSEPLLVYVNINVLGVLQP